MNFTLDLNPYGAHLILIILTFILFGNLSDSCSPIFFHFKGTIVRSINPPVANEKTAKIFPRGKPTFEVRLGK